MKVLPEVHASSFEAPLLRVRGLSVGFEAHAPVVHGVSFELRRGAVLGVLGESGAGKTLTALAIARLLPSNARILSGEILLEGEDVRTASEARMDALRRRTVALLFQDPRLALSPVHRIGAQLVQRLRWSRTASQRRPRGAAGAHEVLLRDHAIELLREVELPEPARLLDAHPQQLSAGMRRRAALALALAAEPELLIADEPTRGLDTPIQAQVLDLLARRVKERSLAVLFISHDVAAVSEIASDVLILKAGKVVEAGPIASVFAAPKHPHTQTLLASVPPRAEVFRTPPRVSERAPRRSDFPAPALDAALGDE